MVICHGYMGIDFTNWMVLYGDMSWLYGNRFHQLDGVYMVICRGYMGIDFTNWMVLYGDMSWLYGNRFHQLDGAIW